MALLVLFENKHLLIVAIVEPEICKESPLANNNILFSEKILPLIYIAEAFSIITAPPYNDFWFLKIVFKI